MEKSRGGKRPGAGAPKGNNNGHKEPSERKPRTKAKIAGYVDLRVRDLLVEGAARQGKSLCGYVSDILTAASTGPTALAAVDPEISDAVDPCALIDIPV